jgi:Fe-S-cluster containining protein
MKLGDLLNSPDDFKDPDKAMIESFPYKAREDGSCEKFIDGKCSVYEDRPVICNIRKRYELYFSNEDWEDHMKGHKRGCDLLQQIGKLDKQFEVKL